MKIKIIFLVLICVQVFPQTHHLYAQTNQILDERLSHLTKAQIKLHYLSLQGMKIYRDEKLDAYIEKVGQRVLAASDHAGKEYAFVIRDNPLPGAHVIGIPVVYIERGSFSVLNSEAELATIIGHEIGHNVGNHGSKRRRGKIGAAALAVIASLVGGNSALGNAINAQSEVTLSARSQEHELESDRYGIEYAYKAGYDPTYLVSGLSQMVDFARLAAGASASAVSHHGLRETHPRDDLRLRASIEETSKLAPGEGYVGRAAFREATDGVLFGVNPAGQTPEGWERYFNKTLGITFLYPDTWSLKVSGAKIVLKDYDKTAQLKVTIEKTADKKQSSLDALQAKFDNLVNPEKIHPRSQRDLGTVGAVPGQRVALAKVARNTFHFQGIAKNNSITAEQDKTFINIIRSFRRIIPKDVASKSEIRIFYKRLEPGETFADLAKQSVGFGDQDVESVLRAINGYYPKGQPEPGTWIKMLRKEEIQEQ